MKDSKFSNVKNNVLVDIILPNYNKGNFLEETINSLINQTYKNFHIYIIDDNSTDQSWDIIKNFKNLDKITSIRLKKNMGPSFCRNYGMRISDSKYISFIDSDDTWEINKLEKQINFMEKENLKFTYTDYVPFFQEGEKRNFRKKTLLKSDFNFDSFIKNSSINTTTMIIRRSILKTNRFKKVKLMEDYLFKCQLLRNNNANKFNESLAYYRILNKSRSSQRLKNIISLWYLNKNYNKLSFLKNMHSIISISINSIKKYGIK
jgi:teichuronic acid biosynthesis glycosyltransferase TuaG